MTDDGPDEIAARLPRPREDEPQSLRQDIVDELADHLACSLLRERLRSDEKQQTDTQLWQRVIHRFGSPSQLARQLWFDWMWEKIMMQRITTILLFVLVLGCGAMLYSMNNTLQNSRLQQAVMLQELMQLKALGTPEPVKNQPTEWNNLSVKVVYDDKANTPVVGAVVKCNGVTEHTKAIPNSQLTSNEKGIVDFGLVLYGQYSISLEVPNGVETKNHVASVRPGKDEMFEVIVPKSPTRPVKFTRILPGKSFDDSGIQSSRLWYHVRLPQPQDATITQAVWTVSWGNTQSKPVKDQEFFVSQDGVINASKLTALEPQDRLIGQVNADDQRIHRFALERWIIPANVVPSETAEVSFGKYSFSEDSFDVYVETELKDGRKILARTPSPLVPYVLLDPTNTPPETIQKSFKRIRKMLEENSLWAYANNWSIDNASQSVLRQRSQLEESSSYGGGLSSEEFSKPTDPFTNQVSTYLELRQHNRRNRRGHGGSFGENVINLSIFPEVAIGKRMIEFSIPVSTSSFQMIKFLNQIDAGNYLISGVVGMSKNIEFKQSEKYDIKVLQDNAEGKTQPVNIVTNASISIVIPENPYEYSTDSKRSGIVSGSCLLSVTKEELLHTLDVLQPIYSEGRFPTIVAVPSEADEPVETEKEAESN